MAKKRVPAIEGWLTMDEQNPQLLGYLDEQSGTYFFPKDVEISHAPGYADAEFKEVALSNRGKLWSYTTNHYEPYTVAAVELNQERMVVLGQLADGYSPDDIEVGMEMELVLGTLYEDEEHEYMIWKWKPAQP
jgi:uncharacterized OB-fold protein